MFNGNEKIELISPVNNIRFVIKYVDYIEYSKVLKALGFKIEKK